jgi:hypothetical protein
MNSELKSSSTSALEGVEQNTWLVQWYGYPLAEASWQFKSKIPKSFIEKI